MKGFLNRVSGGGKEQPKVRTHESHLFYVYFDGCCIILI